MLILIKYKEDGSKDYCYQVEDKITSKQKRSFPVPGLNLENG